MEYFNLKWVKLNLCWHDIEMETQDPGNMDTFPFLGSGGQ